MSRQIPPMPPDEDRHMMIFSHGNQEPMRPEPPSRSPSPELPPNFVPKPPVESSSFPAASNIISLLTRMSGGVSLTDLIIVPAATWDRNNTMWEHKMAQLRKKHRKDWAEKEIELRRKYDELYSDARYRELLVSKELKELEFAQGVASGGVLGKTWREHKAAKQDLEKMYTEKLKESEKELAESKSTIEELRNALAKKETAIEALQNALGRREESVTVELPQQLQQAVQPPQPQQPLQHQQFQHAQPFQQFQNVPHPQQMNTNATVNPAQTLIQAQGIFRQQSVPMQPPPPIYQYPMQPQGQQQQQQHYQETGQSMALVRANPFTSNPGISQFSAPSVPGSFGSAPVGFAAFNATSKPNMPSRQDQPYGQPAGHHQQNQGGNHPNDLRNSQGFDRRPRTNERSHDSHHRGSEYRGSQHSADIRNHDPRHNGDGYVVDVRPDIIVPEIRPDNANPSYDHHSRPKSRESTFTNTVGTAENNTSNTYLAPPEIASWVQPFRTPEGRSVATRPLPPTQPQIAPTTARPSSFTTSTPAPTTGLKGPFGAQNQATAFSGPSFQSAQQPPSILSTINQSQRPSETPKTVSFEQESSRKRLHSKSPKSRRVRVSAHGGEDDPQPAPQLEVSDDEFDAFGPDSFKKLDKQSCPPVTPNPPKWSSKTTVTPGSSSKKNRPRRERVTVDQEKLDRDINDIETVQTVAHTKNDDAISGAESSAKRSPEQTLRATAMELLDQAASENRVICVEIKEGVVWVGHQYIMNRVRGGALENVEIFAEDHKVYVTFIRPAAAQKYFDFFNTEPDKTEAFLRNKLYVTWAPEPVLLMSLEFAQSLASGAKRCLKVSQIPTDKRPEDIMMDFGPAKGVIGVQLNPEKTRRKNNGGMGLIATAEFCSVQHAVEIKRKIESGGLNGYKDCEVEFWDDPCEFGKDGNLYPVTTIRSW